MFATRRQGRLADPATSAAALVGFSMPVFVTGTLLVVLISLTLGWLPPTGARAKGLGESAVAWRHVLRNALLPVVTVVGLQVGSMFAGAVLVEYIFSWPGLNTLLLSSLGIRDYPMIQGWCCWPPRSLSP